MLPTLLGRHDGPWWLSRPCVLAALLCCVVLPMLVPRNLAAVARFSRFSVGMVLFLAASISGLAAAAVAEGRVAPDVHLLPDVAAMGAGSPLGILTALLTVVSGMWAGGQGKCRRCLVLAGTCSALQAPPGPSIFPIHERTPTLLNACLRAVSCLAFTMHFQLLPVKASLKEPSCSAMLRVLRLALAVCALIYATVAISGKCLCAA
jgi:hypothetical protein